MGGKVFDNRAVRMNKDEYAELSRNITLSLVDYFNIADSEQFNLMQNRLVEPLRSVADKETFGDLDVLVNSTFIDIKAFLEESAEYFEVTYEKEIIIENSFISLLEKETNFQIDLILVPDELFDSSSDYLAYNDLGNLIGKLANSLSMRYGHRGLVIPVNGDNVKYIDLLVTSDTRYIHNLLGLDYDRFLKGFKNTSEVFDFIMASKFYNKAYFLPENLSNRRRSRLKKRNSYLEFLEYIKLHDIFEERPIVKQMNMYQALIYTNLATEYVQLMGELEEEDLKRRLFSGHLINRLTNLEGKELGLFMKKYKEVINYSLPISPQINSLFKEHSAN